MRDTNVMKRAREYAPISRQLRKKLLGTKRVNMQLRNKVLAENKKSQYLREEIRLETKYDQQEENITPQYLP
jgi:hypothetical protein